MHTCAPPTAWSPWIRAWLRLARIPYSYLRQLGFLASWPPGSSVSQCLAMPAPARVQNGCMSNGTVHGHIHPAAPTLVQDSQVPYRYRACPPGASACDAAAAAMTCQPTTSHDNAAFCPLSLSRFLVSSLTSPPSDAVLLSTLLQSAAAAAAAAPTHRSTGPRRPPED